jgi:hypothetical protein
MAMLQGEFVTFLPVPGVEPNNKRAQRAVRPSMIARKTSGGNRAHEGASSHLILLSIIRTCPNRGTRIMTFGMSHPAACSA